jgi:hypothetical protein
MKQVVQSRRAGVEKMLSNKRVAAEMLRSRAFFIGVGVCCDLCERETETKRQERDRETGERQERQSDRETERQSDIETEQQRDRATEGEKRYV